MSINQYPGAGSGVLGLDIEPEDTFISVYEDVWQVLKGTSPLSAYMALKRHVHAGNTAWFATRKALAGEAGMSVNTFDRAVQHLVGLGLVVVQHRFVPAGWKGDVSQIVFERSDDAPQQIGSLFHVRFHLPKSKPGTPTQKWGHPLPSNGDTPSPKLGNRHISPDIDPKKGGDTEVEVTGGAGPAPSSPHVSPPPAPAAAGTVPSDWCTAERPRCREHSHIPAGEQVPKCGPCGNVRRWFEDQERQVVEAERERRDGCGYCDDRGLVETFDTAGRPVAVVCAHQGPPEVVAGPEVHTPVSDPSLRRRLREQRRRAG